MIFTKHRISATSFFVLFLKVAAYTPWITEASETHDSDLTSNEFGEAINFLKQGEYVVKLSESYKNVTLVFGDTGEGTTSLVQWLATDGEKLFAVKYKDFRKNYYIADGNKISNSSHDSKTKFPELVVNEDPTIAFYDFPGFNEGQSPKDELAAKYFIQKVINHIEYVKIMLVISLQSSNPLTNMKKCIRFMKRVTHFVKNIEKFRNSIAIVVTKVNLSSNQNEVFEIGKFFETVVKTCSNSNKHIEIIPLIDILTQRTGNYYSRISIFPKPKESGRLDISNSHLKPYKQSIQKIIQQELKFIPKEDNFYPLSVNNTTFINHIAEEIIKNIAKDMKEMFYKVIAQMRKKIRKQNISKRILENTTLADTFHNEMMILDDATEITSLQDITLCNCTNEESYLKFLNVSYIELIKYNLTQIANDLKEPKESLMKDVNEILSKIIKNIASKIDIIEREIYEYYESYMKLTPEYEYKQAVFELNEMQNVLHNFTEPKTESLECISELAKQINNTVVNLNIDNRTKETINTKILDAKYMQSVASFYTILDTNSISLPNNIFEKPFEKTIKRLNDLKKWYEFLSDLYTNRTSISENAKTALLHRNFSMFSQEIKKISAYKNNNLILTELDESKLEELKQVVLFKTPTDTKPCSKEGDYIITGYNIKLSDYIRHNDTLECRNGGKVKTVKIFAIKMIIIDVDLRATQTQLQVIIIAQKWKIDGKREIILNGAPADIKLPKTNNCILLGADGNNGKPGLPGKPGGHFIGIGETFINVDLLTISADGGDGSAGQDGGNGCPGKNGEPAKLSLGFFTGQTSENENKLIEEMEYYGSKIIEMPSKPVNTIFRINGTKGSIGGKGGNGGKGGKGGYEGSVKIIYLDKHLHNIRESAKKGNNGKGGKGGDGGSGGIYGDETIIQYLKSRNAIKLDTVPSNNRAPSGPNGQNDFNDAGIREPEKLSSPPTIATIVNEYKEFLRPTLNNIKNKKMKDLIKDFYTKLDENSHIKKSYDIFHIIQEFYDLENQLPEIDEQDVLPFYETLLNKIEDYELQFDNEEGNRVFNYLYATVLSKIHNLKKNTNPTLVINIFQYLEHIEKKIKYIEAFKERNATHIAINAYKDEYKKNITNRINELENFIIEIAVEIEEINKEMDKNISILIEEITNLKTNLSEKLNELDMKKVELQRILISKGILKIANITQQIFGITENNKKNIGFLMGIRSNPTKWSTLSIQEILEESISAITMNKINNLKKWLNTMYQKLSAYEDQLINIFKLMNNTSKKLHASRNYELTFENVIKLENNMKNALKEEENEMKNHNKSKKALSILKDINHNIEMSSSVFNIYDENKQNQISLDEIFKAIDDDNTILQNLKLYEDRIFKLIAQVFKRTREEFQNAANKLDSKSLVSSDIYKWRIQNILKDLQLEIQQLSKEDMSTNLKNYLEKLNEAMATLVNVHDCIMHYEEQETLMEYIADITSPPLRSTTTINNATLSEALRKLEILMISNFILNEHKLVMNSFKQWVFPFADHFMHGFTSPLRFNVENNIQNLISNVTEQEKFLLSKLREYKLLINTHDKNIYEGEFNSNGMSTKPFYVWKNEEYKREISDLLDGKLITLYADISRSFTKKYAIKFNTINIHLKSKNETLQPKIDKELYKFELRIIHSGNSYYRYGNKFYIIPSGNTYEIIHSFETNPQGEWKSVNQVCEKIRKNDFLLSPYTLWQLQLIPHEDDYYFDNLSSYRNNVDLELIGTGTFFKGKEDLQLDKYYKEYPKTEEGKLRK